jgi:hypothetical protein
MTGLKSEVETKNFELRFRLRPACASIGLMQARARAIPQEDSDHLISGTVSRQRKLSVGPNCRLHRAEAFNKA